MKKIKESELRVGLRLETKSVDHEVSEAFKKIEIVKFTEMEHVKVRSLIKPEYEGIWWTKFLINRHYYRID